MKLIQLKLVRPINLSFMPRILWCVLYKCLFLLVVTAEAQPLQYQFSQLNTIKGLSHNQVSSIFKDSKGFMWFGTMSGLNRFDGYNFKIFKHNLRDTFTLSDDYIISIKEGPGGKLWIESRSGFNIYNPYTESFNRNPQFFLQTIGVKGALTSLKKSDNNTYWFISNAGLYHYRPEQRRTTYYSFPPESSDPGIITDISPASGRFLWLVYSGGVVKLLDIENSKVLYREDLSSVKEAVYRLFTDAAGDLWVYSTDSPLGVFHVSLKTLKLEHYHKSSIKFRLNTNIIKSIAQDDKGVIWVATDHGGINLLNLQTGNVHRLLSLDDNEKSLAQNSINTIYKDDNGIMWVGTFKKGISYYHESIIKFPVYKKMPEKAGGLSYDDVNRFVEDAKGNLWIGTNGGGLIYFDRRNNTYKTYRHDPANPNSLSNDVIVSLCLDYEQKLWIGTYFGGLDCFDGEKFVNYRHNETVPGSLSDDRVWEIMEDSNQNLWVGTLASGLNLFDRKSRTFRHYRLGAPNSIHSNYIAALLEDKEGNLWIGTDNGIDVLVKKNGRFIHFQHKENDPESLSNNNVIALLQDSRGLIWAGTSEGLSIYNPVSKSFQSLRITDGLPDNTILTLLEDDKGGVWLSTPNGLSHAAVIKEKNRYTFRFKNYDEMDGLQSREFNENAALKLSTGELIFGGPNGFNIFNPQSIKADNNVPPLVLTDFQLYNTSIVPGQIMNKNLILKRSISETDTIILKHNQDIFSIEFAALSYFNPQKNKYSYMLEGFNNEWLTAEGSERKATYTNLDPGEYTFRVKGSNDNDVWNEKGVSLKIIIKPPFWKTKIAYLLYLCAIAGLILCMRHRGIQKLKNRFALEQERREAQRMHELDMMKIKFFTNVSHEFRTPLSLILSPLDTIVKQTKDVTVKRQLQLVERNAKRLLHLVNQLLDFRKMEVQELKLNPKEGDIVQFIRESFYSFTDLAEKKNINFTLKSSINSLFTSFDQDKLERILFNLLSNAFKFTHQGGDISLELILKDSEDSASDIEIKVKDTGIGIHTDKQERIFDRFFQNDVPGSMVNQGSGIGLAITKEFVNLHNGKISVESRPDKGTCFTITLPLKKINGAEFKDRGIIEEWKPQGSGNMEPVINRRKPTVLLVEDNEDFRFYLKDNLKQYYNILEAANGRLGWNKTLSMHPELIVSDVSMPEMNGIEFCLKIREDKRTSEIPVILLTALSDEEHLLQGIKTGANDYITKPFNFEILLSKIKNLLAHQASVRKTFQKRIEAAPADIEIESVDEKFIRKALQAVEDNISNPDFSVEDFSRLMCMSRVALYKKLMLLTRKTPIEFIRHIRLKRAASLLEKSQLTIAEIAYEVGFNSPKYFARYFKNEFGILPSSYQKDKEETIRTREV